MNVFQKIAAKFRAALDEYDDGNNFTCDVCGREVFGGERVCNKCTETLPFNNRIICPLCGRRVREAGVCLDCKEKPLAADRARSVFLHEGEAARLVVRYKRGNRYLYRAAAELALPILGREFSGCDFLTGVPMTKTAEQRRGYNQSQLLAEELARRSGKPCLNVLEKRRETQAQKTLGRAEREENLTGCFRVTDKSAVKGKRVLIVDDTLTTGATVSEIAAALKRAGAAAVYALTLTSVEKKDPFGKK